MGRGALLPLPGPDGFPVLLGAFGGDGRFAMFSMYLLMNYLGGFRLCGFTGTVFGPGFGYGVFAGLEGLDLRCGLTGTDLGIVVCLTST